MYLDMVNLKRNKMGEVIDFDIVDTDSGELITPLFDKYTCPENYKKANVKWVEPMTAKEYLNEEALEKMLTSPDYIAEEKLDGTRATLHIGAINSRVFSRRISKKTDWFSENSDSVPQLRGIYDKYLDGTILDGEMRIDGKEFKEVSSTLNCDWKKAIQRQIELGFITLHAFDIVYYRGVYIAKMPLHRRKYYLDKVVKDLQAKGFKYVVSEPYTYDNMVVEITDQMVRDYFSEKMSKEEYPNLYEAIRLGDTVTTFEQFMEIEHYAPLEFKVEVDKRTWYEYILYKGGEGLMLKDKNGHYFHDRGREYTKWKKHLTRECVVMGFSQPTIEYDGDHPETWEYWSDREGNIISAKEIASTPLIKKQMNLWQPVSKFYYLNWVGTMRFGVVVNDLEIKKWEKTNKTKPVVQVINGLKVLEVGECAGYDEEVREAMSNNQPKYIGKTVEIMANEIFKDTGKLRHPRYLRMRGDKNPEQCTWADHII